MAYLIVWELPNYPQTETGDERIVYSKRISSQSMLAYEDARKAIENVYPGRKVASPLEHLSNCLVLGVYISPNKQGYGRIAGNFQTWGVEQ